MREEVLGQGLLAPLDKSEASLQELGSLEPAASVELLLSRRQLGHAYRFLEHRLRRAQHKVFWPLRFLVFFLNLLGFSSLAFRMSGRPLLHPVVERMSRPINPLLLASAWALKRVRGIDYGRCLSEYMAGLDVPSLRNLLRIEGHVQQGELQSVLDAEDGAVDTLLELGRKMLIREGALLPDTQYPTRLDIQCGAWHVANPIWKSVERREAWLRAIAYGFEMNDEVHDARLHYEGLVSQALVELNAAAADSDPSRRDRLRAAALNHRLAVRLLKRAFRLYEWCPHEISAFAAEADFGLLILTATAENSSPDTREMAEGVAERCQKWMLDVGTLEAMRTNRDVKRPDKPSVDGET
jgi:hypothetical protein